MKIASKFRSGFHLFRSESFPFESLPLRPIFLCLAGKLLAKRDRLQPLKLSERGFIRAVKSLDMRASASANLIFAAPEDRLRPSEALIVHILPA
jgi:hypothetical protein